ncbi:MAG: hypothetical protein PUG51_04705 [Firmicutes bacterium]|nr:hypothetical protein [Bacillota bacterium]
MTEKKKKKLRSSRFEDSIKDYARTNSAYTDDNRKRAEEAGLEGGWKAPLNSSEKVMIAAGVIALIGCVIKYVIL